MRRLGLGGTRITDAAAGILGEMKSLEGIYLDYTAFTPAGGVALRRLLPDVEMWPRRTMPPPAGIFRSSMQ